MNLLSIYKRVKITPTCWLWTGCTSGTGNYGTLSVRTGAVTKTHKAHRLVYEMVVGPIPQGLDLDHLCRVRQCVNPAHLEPVTHAENCRRAKSPYCKRGHLLAGNRVRTSKSGSMCAICRRAYHLDYERNRRVRHG